MGQMGKLWNIMTEQEKDAMGTIPRCNQQPKQNQRTTTLPLEQ